MSHVSDSVQLLELLAHTNPRLWELLHPHVPLIGRGLRGQEVSLNPQPLPPGELFAGLNPQPIPPLEAFGLVVTRTAVSVSEAVIAASLAGRNPREALAEIVEDWCGTVPRRIPWPRKWPFPWPPGDPWPIEPEVLARSMQANAGLVFQIYAGAIDDQEMAGAFAEAAERLTDTALQGAG